jgi:hypothetical protein
MTVILMAIMYNFMAGIGLEGSLGGGSTVLSRILSSPHTEEERLLRVKFPGCRSLEYLLLRMSCSRFSRGMFGTVSVRECFNL